MEISRLIWMQHEWKSLWSRRGSARNGKQKLKEPHALTAEDVTDVTVNTEQCPTYILTDDCSAEDPSAGNRKITAHWMWPFTSSVFPTRRQTLATRHPKKETGEHQQLVDHLGVDMLTHDDCRLPLIISAWGAINIFSMENIFLTEAAWWTELEGVISSSSCIWNTYSLLQLFKTVNSVVEVQEECVTGAVQSVKLRLLTITQKSPWCQGEENVQKNQPQRQRYLRGEQEETQNTSWSWITSVFMMIIMII